MKIYMFIELIVTFIPVVLTICTKKDIILKINRNNWRKEIINGNKVVTADFFTYWCSQCVIISSHYKIVDKELNGFVKTIYINNDEDNSICNRINIKNIPIFKIFHLSFIDKIQNNYSIMEYRGPILGEEITNFLIEKLNKNDKNINLVEEMNNFVNNTFYSKVMLFFKNTNTHYIFNILAVEYIEKVQLDEVMYKYNIEIYPSILIFNINYIKLIDYKGHFKKEIFNLFLNLFKQLKKKEEKEIKLTIEKKDENKDIFSNNKEEKNKRPKVSVIIPAYNSEKFIRRCIESAINQTLKDIEIILIDDNSKDTTNSIIDEYSKKDNRIISIFLKENKGAGYSRNKGIEKATGKFIGFIDSDDFVDLKWFEYLYEYSKEADIIHGVRVIYNFENKYRKSKEKPYGCIIPSIIRRSFLTKYNLKFPELKRKGEDSRFRRHLYEKKPRIVNLPDKGIYYHYVKREGSLSGYINKKKEY